MVVLPSEGEMIALWGRRLRRWSREVVEQTGLPKSSQDFLSRVGLPERRIWTIHFDGGSLAELPFKPGWRVLGHDDVYPICLVEPRGGAVIEVNDDRECFFNTDVERFGASLYFLDCFRLQRRHYDERDEPRIAELREQLQSVDPQAFADPEMFWPIILEHVGDGLI